MTAENCRPFTWNTAKLKAAELLADDELTHAQIAEQVGISERQLRNWKNHPDFQAKVTEILREFEAAMLRYPIAQRRKRVGSLNARWRKMLAVIEERAADPAMQGVPGGRTGLLVHQQRAIGTGRNQMVIDEYAVDTGLLKELRSHEQQAAQELGQWLEKLEHSGSVDAPVKVSHEFDFDEYRRAFSEFVGTDELRGDAAEADGTG